MQNHYFQEVRITRMIQAPCKDCSDREIGCHSSCRRYIDFQSLNNKEHEEAYKQKQTIYMINEQRVKAYEKKRKKKGK